jgi:YegS/Rv2252/BmrU family lipid kinase
MLNDRPLVIVNPKAGGGFDERKSARYVGALSSGLGELDVRFTQARGHATELARDAALAGQRLVVAFGGDGTISEVAGGLLAAREQGADLTDLGIIPRGTGGDFRRTLDLPSDITEAARRIRERPAHLIDVGRATFTTDDGGTATRYFVNVASFGFSSAVAAAANKSKKTLGAKVAFVGATLRTLVAHQNTEVFLQLDDAPEVRRTLMLGAVGNGRFFGGGMKICPDAKLDSGEFSFVVVGDMGKMDVVMNLPKLFAGTHLSLEDVAAATAKVVRARPVNPDEVIPLEMDGETPGRLPATIEIVPRALRLRF